MHTASSIPKEKAFIFEKQQQIGMPISQRNFDKLVSKFENIKEGDSLKNIQDYITFVRLFNTIYYSDLYKVPMYKKCANLFSRYFVKTVGEIGALGQKGSWFYSKKYDLSIGGPPNNNSQFIIVN